LKTAAADAPPPVIAAAVPFQSDLSEIIEEPPPPHMRRTSQILAAFVVIGLLVSAVAEIDVVVRGTGKLTVDGPPLVLQPIERAILKTLVVKPGEVVRKGQVLATLDPTFAEADVSAIDSQQRMLSAQLRRVEAEAKDVPNYVDTRTPEDALQSDIFRQRRQELALRLRAFDEEIKRGEAGLRTLDVERTLLEQQLSVAKDVEQMRSTLFASQSGSRLQFLESRSVRIRAEKDHQGATDRLVELRHDLDAKRAERQAFIEEWRRRLYEETDRLRTELARIEGAQSKARKYRDLIQIRAPEDGVVIDIAKRSVGSVLREAETLITLAPSDMPLIAEVALASADVGYAKPGDTVIVKVDTFPYMRHGTLKG
jgi:HlyD family secretion protein